jgi:hypothetical protein
MSGTVSVRPVSRVVSLLCFSFSILAIIMIVAFIPNIFGMGFFFLITCACIGAGLYFQKQETESARMRMG